MKPKRGQRSETEWRSLIEKQQQSGQTILSLLPPARTLRPLLLSMNLKTAVEKPQRRKLLSPQAFAEKALVTQWVKRGAVENPNAFSYFGADLTVQLPFLGSSFNLTCNSPTDSPDEPNFYRSHGLEVFLGLSPRAARTESSLWSAKDS